ncbi:hemerythrin domain-containing protein [Streptomyces sp. NPDC088757]|uniref:hemerythrin domain-containing protein n=1 Tax=Streptomyces sp. NPDC088757 TaxID=3365889 RepID=UPI0037F463DE
MATSTGPGSRLAAFGNQLIAVHLWLREELERLTDGLDAYLDGEAERPRELRAHCLTFCSAVRRHHTEEDDSAFPALADEFPELRPVLEELERDHHTVADILRRVEELLDGLHEGSNAQDVRNELDGLAALLESHFVYEEKKIVSALNELTELPGGVVIQDVMRQQDPH